MPEVVFVEERRGTVPTTHSATPAEPSTSESTPTTGASTETTDTMEQTIGMMTITDPGSASGNREQLPIISTVFSMSTAEGTEDPEREQTVGLEYVSTVTRDFEPYDPKEQISSHDLRIKKELVEDRLQPGDPEYYINLQYVYQNLQKAEEAVEASKNTTSYNDNLRKYNSMSQILENMKTAYFYHAKCIGKVLSEGWDMVELAKAVPPRGARGMKTPIEDDDPDYHPEPIDKLDPTTMGLKRIEEYMDKFDKELEELKEIQQKETAKDYTRAKMNRREELENKFSEFEIEREVRLARRGGSKREGGTSEDVDPESQGESEIPKGQSDLKSPWDQSKPKKGTYPALGPKGPGDLDVQKTGRAPLNFSNFEYNDEGWINCTTGYYWHSVLGGGIYLYEDEWYRNWEFDYKPPEEEIVQDEPDYGEDENPELPQESPGKGVAAVKESQNIGEEPLEVPQHSPS